jgi:NadR type nicotinamide-nucleotide adenylyltransferase
MEKGIIKKIAIVGAESTGKTWLCEKLAAHFSTVWVPEYAREYFNDSDIYNYTLDDLEIIAKKQLHTEDELINKASRFLFCDTTLITLKIWSELEFESTPEFIAGNLNKSKYSYYFITDNQIPWVADRLRENKHSRELLFEMNEYEVKKSGVPYSIISGTDEQRLKNAISILDNL